MNGKAKYKKLNIFLNGSTERIASFTFLCAFAPCLRRVNLCAG